LRSFDKLRTVGSDDLSLGVEVTQDPSQEVSSMTLAQQLEESWTQIVQLYVHNSRTVAHVKALEQLFLVDEHMDCTSVCDWFIAVANELDAETNADTLSDEAKETLTQLQRNWFMTMANVIQRVAHLEEKLPKGTLALTGRPDTDTNWHEEYNDYDDDYDESTWQPVEELTNPFRSYIDSISLRHPELIPWTKRVAQLSTFLQRDALQEVFASSSALLPDLLDPLQVDFDMFAREFQMLSPEHQVQTQEFLESYQMGSLMSVLRSR